jgi:hypothetical protein
VTQLKSEVEKAKKDLEIVESERRKLRLLFILIYFNV